MTIRKRVCMCCRRTGQMFSSLLVVAICLLVSWLGDRSRFQKNDSLQHSEENTAFAFKLESHCNVSSVFRTCTNFNLVPQIKLNLMRGNYRNIAGRTCDASSEWKEDITGRVGKPAFSWKQFLKFWRVPHDQRFLTFFYLSTRFGHA